MVGAKRLRAVAIEYAFATGSAQISTGLSDEMALADLEHA